MQALEERDLVSWLQHTTKPVLGICLGMQLLYESSAEVIPGDWAFCRVGWSALTSRAGRCPIGWNAFSELRDHPLLDGLRAEQQMYYVHSYYAPVTGTRWPPAIISYRLRPLRPGEFHGGAVSSGKSGENSEVLLRNFLKMVRG